MATVKINNKNYTVPQLGFAHMQQLESEGISVVELIRKKQVFSMAAAAIIVCTGLSIEGANNLAEQHVLGGGKLDALYQAFSEAINESAFFKKLLEENADEENAVEAKK